MAERKDYFSGNPRLYGYNVEISVLPLGLHIECIIYSPGSVSDLEGFQKIYNLQREAFIKVVRDLDDSNDSLLKNDYKCLENLK